MFTEFEQVETWLRSAELAAISSRKNRRWFTRWFAQNSLEKIVQIVECHDMPMSRSLEAQRVENLSGQG